MIQTDNSVGSSAAPALQLAGLRVYLLPGCFAHRRWSPKTPETLWEKLLWPWLQNTVTPTLLLAPFSTDHSSGTLHNSCTACFSFILVSLTALGNLGLRALAGLYKTKSFFFLSLPFFSFLTKHICQLLHWSLIHKTVCISRRQRLVKGNIFSCWEVLRSTLSIRRWDKINSYLELWLLVFLSCLFQTPRFWAAVFQPSNSCFTVAKAYQTEGVMKSAQWDHTSALKEKERVGVAVGLITDQFKKKDLKMFLSCTEHDSASRMLWLYGSLLMGM